jgi:hypothetical protein
MPARTLMAINCKSLFPPNLTIIMVFSGRSAICRSNGIFGDRTMPAELVDLNRILLTLAVPGNFLTARHAMDMISLRRSIPRDTSIRSSGSSIVATAGFGGFGRARTTKSVASCTSLAALNTHAGFSTTIPVGMTTMKSATSSVNMHFCRATMSRSAEGTASSKRFASSASILSCCRWPWSNRSNWKSRCDPRSPSTTDYVAAAG